MREKEKEKKAQEIVYFVKCSREITKLKKKKKNVYTRFLREEYQKEEKRDISWKMSHNSVRDIFCPGMGRG